MCFPPQMAQTSDDPKALPPVVPLADAKQNALKGDESTISKAGDELRWMKSTEAWDKVVADRVRNRQLDAEVQAFADKRKKELGL